MESRSSLEREVLHWGLDDWVMASDVEGAARAVGGAKDTEEAGDMSVAVIRKMLVEGLVEAGWIVGGEFKRWSGTPAEAADQIEQSWRDLNGRSVLFGEVCWLNLTDLGESAASNL